MFSINCNILTGPFLRPDITDPNDLQINSHAIPVKGLSYTEQTTANGNDVLILIKNEDKPGLQHVLTYSGLKIYWLNQCGFIPVLSTVTGFGRTLLGLVHTIYHLAGAIFDCPNRTGHLWEAGLGVSP